MTLEDLGRLLEDLVSELANLNELFAQYFAAAESRRDT